MFDRYNTKYIYSHLNVFRDIFLYYSSKMVSNRPLLIDIGISNYNGSL